METTVDRIIERPCSYKVVNEEKIVQKDVIVERIKEVENIVNIEVIDTKVNEIEIIAEQPTVKMVPRE